MFRKSLILFLSINILSKIKSEKLTFLHISENLDTLKLLKGLSDFNSTSLCGQHVKKLLTDLNLEKGWALLMFDSSAKTPSGLLKGNTINLGQFDECLEIQNQDSNFTGQHCMLQVNAYQKNTESEFNLLRLFPSPEVIGNANYLDYSDDIQFGFCVPSTCAAEDIADGLNSMFNESKSDKIFSVTVKEENCQVKNSTKLKSIHWAAWGLLLFFIVISMLSTVYDVVYQRFSSSVRSNTLLTAFSLYSNGKKLFEITENSDQLKALHGIRVLSTFWIVLHHTFWDTIEGMNEFDTIKFYHDVQHIPLYNGFVAVDTFFFLSGMLTCIVFFREIKKKSYYDVPLGYIHRYIRLTPSFAAMIFIVGHVYIYLGNGPLWHAYVDPKAEICSKNWWTGLLYIQNFVHSDEMCLIETWYLAADMQLHWLSPVILYAVFFWSVYAKFIFAAILMSLVSVSLILGYNYNLGPNSLYSRNPFQEDIDYFPFYTRAAPYIIGLGTGYFVNQIRNEKIPIKLNKLQVLAGWLVATGLCLATLYCSIPFAKGNIRSTLDNVLYLYLHRVAWGFGLSWIVFACLNGYGGPVNAFLSWNLFQPFSKLSYSVYLIHSTLISYKTDSARTIPYGGDTELVYNFFGVLVLSHLFAIPLALIIEMPFGNLDKYFFENVKILPIPWPKKEAKEENYFQACETKKSVKEETFKQVEIVSTP